MTGKVEPLETKFEPQPADNVTSYEQSWLWTTSGPMGQRYNPDDLVGRYGLPVYAKMMNDEQVKAVTDFKLSAILARGWQFKYDEESELNEEEQKKRSAVFAKIVKKMKGSFADALDSIASGREFGFSVTEKVYGKVTCEGKLYAAINQLLTRDPCTFEFFTDDYGTLTQIKQRVNRGLEIPIDQDRVIHYVHRPKWDRIYGRSDLRSAYRSWYAKDNLVKMWLLYLEKYAGGIAVASRDGEGAPLSNDPDFPSLQNALKNLSSTRSIILPKGVTLEIFFPTTTDQYEKAIVYHDLAIAKALLVPNLLGLSHTGQTGAYSQSQTQFEAFMWTLRSDAQRIEETLNEQLFKDLGDQNWGDDDYPSFVFKPVSMEHAKWLMTTWKELLGAKAVIATEEDERFLREMLEFPARDEESTPLVTPMDQQAAEQEQQKIDQTGEIAKQKIEQKPAANEDKYAAAMEQIAELRTQVMIALGREPQAPAITTHVHAGFNPDQERDGHGRFTADGMSDALTDHVERESGSPNEGPQDERERTIWGLKKVIDSSHPSIKKGHKNEARRVLRQLEEGASLSTVNVCFHGTVFGHTNWQLERAARRVSFAVIDRRAQEVETFAVNDLAAIMARAVRRALGNDEQMHEYLDSETSDVAGFTFNPTDMGRIKSACRGLLDRSWNLGQGHAANEIAKARGAEPETAQASVHLASLRGKAATYFDTQSFRMAGDASDAARKIIQQELQNGIKFSTSTTEVRTNIWNRLVAKGMTKKEAARGVETDAAVNKALDELWVDTEEEAVAYLNTLVRTNTFEALNEARFAEFTDPDLADFVVGLQYASVMDDSTTEICEELDDRIYATNSEVWDTYRPPNHFGCRGILIPVTTLDDWDGVESEVPDIEPQEGFK